MENPCVPGTLHSTSHFMESFKAPNSSELQSFSFYTNGTVPQKFSHPQRLEPGFDPGSKVPWPFSGMSNTDKFIK